MDAGQLRQGAALGFLFALGVILLWSAVIGHTGLVLAAMLAPSELQLVT